MNRHAVSQDEVTWSERAQKKQSGRARPRTNDGFEAQDGTSHLPWRPYARLRTMLDMLVDLHSESSMSYPMEARVEQGGYGVFCRVHEVKPGCGGVNDAVHSAEI